MVKLLVETVFYLFKKLLIFPSLSAPFLRFMFGDFQFLLLWSSQIGVPRDVVSIPVGTNQKCTQLSDVLWWFANLWQPTVPRHVLFPGPRHGHKIQIAKLKSPLSQNSEMKKNGGSQQSSIFTVSVRSACNLGSEKVAFLRVNHKLLCF